jgi:hypothetical protein
MNQPSDVRKLAFWILVGMISVVFVEVPRGSATCPERAGAINLRCFIDHSGRAKHTPRAMVKLLWLFQGFHLKTLYSHDGMTMAPFILEPLAGIKAQTAGAMSLTGQDVECAVAVKVHRVGAGDHLG